MRNLVFIVVCSLLIASCNFNGNSSRQANDNRYEYVDVTPALIEELGGPEALKQYQFFTSNSFSLYRVDNDKSANADGSINSIDNNLEVVFTDYTPGVIKRYYKRNYDEVVLEIYFDNEDNAFLEFQTYGQTRDISNHQFELRKLGWFNEEVTYKDQKWYQMGNNEPTVLQIQIDKSKTYTKEVAKGRTLNNNQ